MTLSKARGLRRGGRETSAANPGRYNPDVVPLLALALAFGVWAAPAHAQSADLPQVLVSRQLAEERALAVGQTVRLAAGADGEQAQTFRIAGVYEPVPDPSRLGSIAREVRLHLPDLLSLTREPNEPSGAGHVEAINIGLVDPGDARQFASDVNGVLPGIAARPTTDAAGSAAPFVVLRRFHLAIAIVTILAATIFLLALSVMLVDERRETVGVLRLIGCPVGRILSQVFVEGLLIAAAGGLFGLALAAALERLINVFFQWRYDTALIFVRVTPAVAAICFAIALPLGAAATVTASWLLLRRSGLRLARR
jgi:putative ABC transport system permease protein